MHIGVFFNTDFQFFKERENQNTSDWEEGVGRGQGKEQIYPRKKQRTKKKNNNLIFSLKVPSADNAFLTLFSKPGW